MKCDADHPPQPYGYRAEIQALSEAIDLAPLGVLSSESVAQLIALRERITLSQTPE